MDDFFNGKTVLVTGGTGFLGNALVSKLLEFNPKAIRVLSNDEFGHFNTQKRFQSGSIRHLVGDVRDFERMKTACQGVDIVIHGAALKRIDLIEYNVIDAIKTNVNGTVNVVRACLEQEVKKAIFISTDKACSPVNSYGATKMLGERIFIETNYNQGESKTEFLAVRYGNVMNSTGSVIPFFIERIKKGDEIPITDERMTRFLISEERAVKEVLDALKYGRGGEIFVPKLVSHKVVELVEALKEHYGKDSGVKFIGIRPGEKIHECMVNESEAARTFEFGDHYVILPDIGKGKYKMDYPYLDGKERVSFRDYCSDKPLVERQELRRILEEAKVLD